MKPTKLLGLNPAVITVRIHSRAVHLFIVVNCEGRLSLCCHLLINTQTKKPCSPVFVFYCCVCVRPCSVQLFRCPQGPRFHFLPVATRHWAHFPPWNGRLYKGNTPKKKVSLLVPSFLLASSSNLAPTIRSVCHSC